MPINPEKTARFELYLPVEIRDALIGLAEKTGVSASKLACQAIKEMLMGDSGLKAIDARLERIERLLGDRIAPPGNLEDPEKHPKRSRVNPSARMPHTPVLETSGDVLAIDELLKRFQGDRALVARLYIVGGSKGDLFKGDLARAEKVATYTRGLDPEGLPWLPVDPQRRNWIQLEPKEWVRKVMEFDPPGNP